MASFDDEIAWAARRRLEKASEKHTVVLLPCCGAGVEIVDTKKDNFVTCPACKTKHVLMTNLRQVRSENDDGTPRRLTW